MPTKQTLPLPFIGGMDTRTDPLQILPPKMAVLDNALFVPGGIKQRHGMKKIGELAYVRNNLIPSFLNDVAVSSPRMLLTRDGDLALISDFGFYNLAPDYGKWHKEGNLSTLFRGMPLNSVRSGRLLPSIQLTPGTVRLSDVAITDDGLMVVAYEDVDSSTISYAVFDSATGAHIGSGGISSANCVSPRAVSLGSSVLVFGVDRTAAPYSIRAVLVNRAAAILLTGYQSIVVNADVNATSWCYDVVGVKNGRALLAYNSTTANTIKHGWVDTTGGAAFTSQATANAPQMIGVAVDTDRSYGVAWGMSTVNRVDAAQYTEASANKFAAANISIGTITAKFLSPDQTCIACVFSQTGLLDVFYDNGIASATPYAKRLLYTQIDSAGGTVIGQQTCTTGVELWSRAWTQGQLPLVLVKHVSTRNGFIVGAQTTGPIGQFMPGEVGDGPSQTRAHPFGGDVLGSRKIFALSWLPGGNPLGSQLPGAQILRSCEIDFDDMQAHQFTQVGECTYISGSMMRVYDGLSMVEAGFLTSPYLNVAAAGAATGGGLLPATTYHYRLVYEAYTHDGSRFKSDALGQGTSDALDFSVTTGGGDNCVNVTFPSYTPSLRNSGTYCGFILYRRQQSGTIYNRVSTANPAATTYQKNNPISNALVTIQDTMAEASLIQQELDDISQGVATPTFPPPHTVMRSGNGRVFISGMDDPDVIMYSLERSTGEPLQFTSENRIVVQQGDGPVTALVAVSDSLIVFRQNQVYICGGEGLDNTGQTGIFSTPRLISSEIGCDEPRSIVEIPGGAAFKSAKGYYIVSPGDGSSGLKLDFIGADVDDFNGLPVNAAVLMPRLHQIRWVTDSITLVYDYEFKQWSRFTYGGKDALIWNGDFVLLPGESGKVLRETEGYWLDDTDVVVGGVAQVGRQYSLVAESGWIRAEAITGRQRLYEVLVSGAKVADHVVTILLAYDGEPAWVDRRTWDPQAALDQAGASYGGQKYGAGQYGGTNVDGSPSTTVYQFSVKPRVQRCSMVKFRIEMGPPPGTTWTGGSATLAEVALVLGVREGAVKLGKGKRA